MTRASGRGRGWRRKLWHQLAPSTQRKYQRLGINATAHNRGISPAKLQRWLEHQERYYGWELEGPNLYSMTVNGVEYMAYLPTGDDLADLIERQEQSEASYTSGEEVDAHNAFIQRRPNVPEWMYFYHGAFS